ncbi:hypothetical protein MRX96_029595 [Rhipicephalus microplus]
MGEETKVGRNRRRNASELTTTVVGNGAPSIDDRDEAREGRVRCTRREKESSGVYSRNVRRSTEEEWERSNGADGRRLLQKGEEQEGVSRTV